MVRPLLSQGVLVARRTKALPIKVLGIKGPAQVSTNARVSLVVPVRWVDVPVSPQDPVPDLSQLQRVNSSPRTLQ